MMTLTEYTVTISYRGMPSQVRYSCYVRARDAREAKDIAEISDMDRAEATVRARRTHGQR